MQAVIDAAREACLAVVGPQDPAFAPWAASEWAEGRETFYSHPQYVWNVFDCYRLYTHATCRLLEGDESMRVPVIFDGHAGCGCSSAHMALTSRATVHCHAYGAQANVAARIARALRANVLVTPIPLPCDTFVWLESAEHCERPGEVWDELHGGCEWYVDASSFSVDALGHREWFLYDGQLVHKSRARRALTKHLALRGYRKVRMCFNNRPSFYRRQP